jgi:ATP-binding cassette subfamily B protein
MSELQWDDELDPEEQTLTRFVHGIRTFWNIVRTEHVLIYWLFGAIVLCKGIELLAPLALKSVFDIAQSILDDRADISALVPYVIVAFLIGLVGDVLTRYVRAPIFFTVAIRLEKDLPIRAHQKLLALSQGYHARNSIGKNSAKIAKGCEKTISIADHLAWGLVPSLVYIIINIVMLVAMDWRLAALFLSLAIPAVWLNLKSYERFSPRFQEWDQLKEVANARFFDTHRNGATVRDFVAERYEDSRFADVRTRMFDLDIELNWKIQAYLLAIGVFMHAAFIATVVLSIYLAVQGEVTLGTAVFVAMTTNVTRQGLWEIVNNYTHIMREVVSVERLDTLLRETEDVQNESDDRVPRAVGNLEIGGIDFGYRADNRPIFRDLTLTIDAGRMVAFVGESGSGKTTLAKLIARVYDVTGGSIQFLGRDIRDWNRDSYRRLFATVSQAVDIFDTTIRDNITYGNREASDEDVARALTAASLDSVLADQGRFPEGLATKVGENGVQLSDGERQRVGIARAYLALLRGAQFLILDEATSALDSGTERVIQEFVEMLRRERAVAIIAIAHRLATIQKADEIIVLEKGRVIECGDHTALLAQGGVYARLVNLQNLGAVRD